MSSPTSQQPAKGEARPERGKRGKVRSTPKGRAVDPKAREEVRALLGDAPTPRPADRAPAQDPGPLSLSVGAAPGRSCRRDEAGDDRGVRVATFYHHFDVVKEGDAAPPSITVRVCDSIACELAGRTSCSTSCRRCSAGHQGASCPLCRALRDRSRGGGGTEPDSERHRRTGGVRGAAGSRDAPARRRSGHAPAFQRRHARPHRLQGVRAAGGYDWPRAERARASRPTSSR